MPQWKDVLLQNDTQNYELNILALSCHWTIVILGQIANTNEEYSEGKTWFIFNIIRCNIDNMYLADISLDVETFTSYKVYESILNTTLVKVMKRR